MHAHGCCWKLLSAGHVCIQSLCKAQIGNSLLTVYVCHCACREFSGRGVYQWARGGLRQRLKDMRRPQGSLTLQVETLSGLVLALDMVSCL